METIEQRELVAAFLGEAEMPRWVDYVTVGRWLHIPPWEVEKAPPEWVDRVLATMRAGESAYRMQLARLVQCE